MMYDEELYNISKLVGVTSPDQKNEKETVEVQKRLFKYMIEKLKKEISNPKALKSGSVSIKFNQRFYCEPDPGYREIKKLIENNSFHSFASEYCIYITGVENRCNEWYSAYYELTWDYQTYFNSMKQEVVKKRKLNNKGGI